MKKLIYSALGAMSLILGSCSNESAIPPQIPGGGDEPIGDGNLEVVDKPQENLLDRSLPLSVKSSMTSDHFYEICESIMLIAEENIDNNENFELTLSNIACEEFISPLIEDGKDLQNQLVQYFNDGITEQSDIEYLENLSNEEIASLSFVYHTLIVNSNPGTIEQFELTARQERVIHCLSVAVGIDSIRNIAIKGLIDATTIRATILAIGKRYLGYIGVVLMVYEFTQCVS